MLLKGKDNEKQESIQLYLQSFSNIRRKQQVYILNVRLGVPTVKTQTKTHLNLCCNILDKCVYHKTYQRRELTSYWFKSFSGNSVKKWLAFTIHFVPSWPYPGLGAKVKDLLEEGKPISISHMLPPFSTHPWGISVTRGPAWCAKTGLSATVQGLELGRMKTSLWSDFLPPLPLLLPLFFDEGEVWLWGLAFWGSWDGGPFPFWAVLGGFWTGFMEFCKWVLITRCCSELSFICLIGMLDCCLWTDIQSKSTRPNGRNFNQYHTYTVPFLALSLSKIKCYLGLENLKEERKKKCMSARWPKLQER